MNLIEVLKSKKHKEAHDLLQQIEIESYNSNKYYCYFEDFLNLINDKNSYVRVRGFRLACAQSKWDVDQKIEKNLKLLLTMLYDDKPTAVRQCLEALHSVVLYKPEICANIDSALNKIDLSNYKDSMSPLIEKDIASLKKIII